METVTESHAAPRESVGLQEEVPPRPVPAILVGRDGDRRLLLRGILALEHHPIAFEAREPAELADLPPAVERELLVLDLDADDGAGGERLADLARTRPSLRTVVLLPPGSDAGPAEALRLGARVALTRPFTLRAFREAVGDALADAPGGGPR